MPIQSRLIRQLRSLHGIPVSPYHKNRVLLHFHYPRWYARATPKTRTSAIPAQTSKQNYRQDTDHAAAAGLLGHAHSEQGDSRHVTNDHVPNTRPSQRLASLAIGHKKGDEQIRQRQLRHRLGYTDALDWRPVLALLIEHTELNNTEAWKQTRHVRLPAPLAEIYKGDLGHLFLEILMTTESHVQQRTERPPVLILQGTEEANRRAMTILEKKLGNVELLAMPAMQDFEDESLHAVSDDERQTQPPPRSVWVGRTNGTRSFADITFRNIERPSQWSTIAFANYVDTITSAQPSRQSLRAEYGPQSPTESNSAHEKGVSEALVSLFEDSEMSRYVSTDACNWALTYLAHHRRLPDARRIVLALEKHKIDIMATPFNTLLDSAAEAQDLHNFRFVLNMMLKFGRKPNWQSWASLARLVSRRSMSEARDIVNRMRENGLLKNPAVKKEMASVLVKYDYERWIEDKGTTATFLEHYDKLFDGETWMDDSATNRMIAVRATRGEYDAADSLIDEMERRGGRCTIATLDVLLTACTDQGNTKAAVSFTSRLLGSSSRINPNETTYRQLFLLAWNRRSVNMLRVVWRYACMAGHNNFMMRRAMNHCIHVQQQKPAKSSKAPAISDKRPSRSEVFKSVAPNIALGLSSQTKVSRPDGPEQASTHSEDAKPAPDLAAICQRLFDLVVTDAQQAGRLRPVNALAPMLEKALAMDSQWKEEGLTGDVDAMLERAIEVPVYKYTGHESNIFSRYPSL